jgi:FkbM family methyltransferase
MGSRGVAVIYDLDDRIIKLIDNDDRMVLHMQDKGYERESLAAWAAMIKPGRVALDIGAYTGLFSIIAAMKGAHAVAFEPMPANRWRLSVNIALNKAKVVIHDCAVSDDNGITELHYNPRVPLTTGASLEAGDKLHHDSIRVTKVSIDSLAFKNIACMKIDVERHEPAVLRGAMKTIKRDRPALLIETLDDAARNEVLRLLPAYRVNAVLDGRNTLFTP